MYATRDEWPSPVGHDGWDLRVLGPLELHAAGEPVSLGGPQQRLVLALLVASDGPLTTDQLIGEVWPLDPPPTARKTIQVHIANLRRRLHGDSGPVRPAPNGYRFDATSSRVDAAEFEALVTDEPGGSAADPAQVAARYRRALDLWVGAAYADMPDTDLIRAEQVRLNELRVVALEQRIELELELGRHRGLIGELEALTIEHPYRERFVGQLMLALYRSGRQADALQVLRRARSRLDEELGIEPAAELRTLERQILRHDPTLDLAATMVGTGAASLGTVRHDDERPITSVRGYELRERVVDDDVAVVHRAYEAGAGREVAVTIIGPNVANSPAFVQQFETDAQRISRLEHPHILSLRDSWRDPGGAYLVMPWPRGGTLTDRVAQAPWSAEAVLRLTEQVGAALRYAHRHGATHGAVAPDNVVLDDEGNAYLSGFGIAVAGSDVVLRPPTTPLTTSSAASSAVSAADGRGAADDVADLAAMSLTLLTGGPPAAGDDAAPELRTVLAAALSADLDHPVTVDHVVRAVRRVAGGVEDVSDVAPLPLAEVRNPYKGLHAFRRTDAADFHGRDDLVARLVDAVANHRLVTLVGPSGSGKSSVARAGLLPRMPELSDRPILFTEMLPGTDPFAELETALLRIAVHRPDAMLTDLTADAGGLARVAAQIVPNPGHRILLVIDQFEELFSLVDDIALRTRFLDALVHAVTAEDGRVAVVATLRADFFDRPLEHPHFGELLRRGLVPVAMPGSEEMARAIARPAHAVGLELEPGLTDTIVADVADQPGGLPLLQYTLTELVATRQSNRLTLDDYHRTGGVAGALGQRAEQLYLDLDDDARAAVRQVFLRLVTVGDGGDDVRRRVRRSELIALGVDRAALERVLAQYGRHRLLSFDRDPVSRGPTVEVAHEALLREWDRLRAWIRTRRGDLVVHRRLAAAVEDWERSGRDASYLAQGGRLAQFETAVSDGDLSLTRPERDFLAASRARRTAAQQREARNARRLRRILASVTLLAVVAVIAGVLARVQQSRAVAARFAAETRRLVSDAPVVARTNLQLGLLLAAEAHRRQPGPQTLGALQRVLARTDGFLGYVGEGRTYTDVAWTPDGALVAAHDGGVAIIDPNSRTERRDIAVPSPTEVEVSPTAPIAAVLTRGSPIVRLVDLDDGDVTELTLPAASDDADSTTAVVRFSPDGSRLATGTFAGDVVLWDIAAARPIWRHRAHPETDIPYETSAHEPLRSGLGTTHLAFSPDGTRLATAGLIYVRVWDLDDHRQIGDTVEVFRTAARGARAPVAPLAIALDAQDVVTVATGWGILDWDARNGELVAETPVPDTLGSVGSTANVIEAVLTERSVALTSNGGRTAVVDRDSGEGREFQAQVPGLARPAADDKAERVAVAGEGRISLWSLDGDQLIATALPLGPGVWDGADVSSDGTLVAIGSIDQQSGALWDLSSTRPRLVDNDIQAYIRQPDDQLWIIDISDVPVEFHRVDPTTLAQIGPTYRAPTAWLIHGPVNGWLAVSGGTADPVVRVFGSDTGVLRHVLELPTVDARDQIGQLDVSPDGRHLVATTVGGAAGVWDTRSWELVAPLSDGGGEIVSAAYSPDGNRLITTSADGAMSVRDTRTFRRIGDPIATGSGAVVGTGLLEVDHDGHYASLTDYDFAQVWDLRERVQIGDDFPLDPGTGAATDADVRWMVTIADGRALVWDLDMSAWARIACEAAGRNLTRQEWAQFLPNDDYRATCPQWLIPRGGVSDGGTEPRRRR